MNKEKVEMTKDTKWEVFAVFGSVHAETIWAAFKPDSYKAFRNQLSFVQNHALLLSFLWQTKTFDYCKLCVSVIAGDQLRKMLKLQLLTLFWCQKCFERVNAGVLAGLYCVWLAANNKMCRCALRAGFLHFNSSSWWEEWIGNQMCIGVLCISFRFILVLAVKLTELAISAPVVSSQSCSSAEIM